MLKYFLPAGNKNVVYFIMYVVLITELLIVITERDELEEKEHEVRDKMLASIAKSYEQPVILFLPVKEATHNIKSKEPSKTILTPLGLVSEEEKQTVVYHVDIAEDSRRTPPDWPEGGISSENGTDLYSIQKNSDGSAMFLATLKRAGEYNFSVYFEVERQLPSYLPDYLLEDLEKMIGEHKNAKSAPETFKVTAKVVGGVKKKEAEIFF